MEGTVTGTIQSAAQHFFDTHCHLDAPVLKDRIGSALHEARRQGVDSYLIPGVHPEGWQQIAELSRQHDGVYAAFGVHPMHAALVDDAVLEELERLAPQATALGEIGLDYALPSAERETQQRAFRAQLGIARRFQLPVLLHCRRAFPDLLRIVAEEKVAERGGVLHAFSGSVEIAAECLRFGLYISLCGTVTFSNAVKPVAVAQKVPLDRLLLETDAPDLPPEPHRGQVNEPAHLIETARKVAAVRGMTLAEVAQATTSNALRLFRL